MSVFTESVVEATMLAWLEASLKPSSPPAERGARVGEAAKMIA